MPPDGHRAADVVTPSGPPPSMSAVMATISASYLIALGHRSACSGLAWELRV